MKKNSENREKVFKGIFFLVMIVVLPILVFTAEGNSQAFNKHEKKFNSSRRETPVQQFNRMLEVMQQKGYDVSEAAELEKRARLAMQRGDRQEGRKLLSEAIENLTQLEKKYSGKKKEKTTEISKMADFPITTQRALVTTAVPDRTSDEDHAVDQYTFVTETIEVQNGSIRVPLSGTPVFIEEVDTSDSNPKQISGKNDSPFGITYAGFYKNDDHNLNLAKESGAAWLRFRHPIGGLVWDLIERNKGRYEWHNTDDILKRAHEHDFEIMVNLYPISSWDQPGIDVVESPLSGERRLPARYPTDIESYLKFISNSVERYDGDGKNDAQGSPVVKGWIVGCEMESPARWVDTPEKYGKLFVETYKSIKESDPGAMVSMYGSNFQHNKKLGQHETFLLPVLHEIKEHSKYIPDFSFILSLHYYEPNPYGLIQNIIEVRHMLKGAGFKDVPLWVTDAATFSNVRSDAMNFRSESELAEDLVKLYSVAIGNGVENFVWALLSDEYKRTGAFESGLLGRAGSNFSAYKKMTYYAYKLMVEKLDNSDWKRTRIITQEEGEKFIYRFVQRQTGKFTYIAWSD